MQHEQRNKESELFRVRSGQLLQDGKKFPEFCLTTNTDHKLIQETKELYQKDEFVSKLAHAAAEIEGTYFGKITRVEEIVLFAKRIGAKKIGIATCVGLMNEAKIFARILQAKGLESYCVICKVSATDKTEIGIDKNLKIKKTVMNPYVIRSCRQSC